MHAKHLRQAAFLTLAVALFFATILFTAFSPEQLSSPVDAIGHSRTQMPDGSLLIIGGRLGSEVLTSAASWNPATGRTTILGSKLSQGRAWHTAVLLPNGQVLIFGGINQQGQVIAAPELYDPDRQTFSTVAIDGLSARAYHSATVITDGQVLLAGGISESDSNTRAELWDYRSGQTRDAGTEMLSARRGPKATLQANGAVLLSGGSDQTRAEEYVPWLQAFQWSLEPPQAEPPQVAGSFPSSGATDVPVDVVIGIRFSMPADVLSVDPTTVVLGNDGGHTRASVVPVEEGRLVFVTPKAPLAPSTHYTVAISGVRTTSGAAIPYSVLSITTAAATASPSEISSNREELLSPFLGIQGAMPADTCKQENNCKVGITAFIKCFNDAKKAGIVNSVSCIPQDKCKFIVTTSDESAQKACSKMNEGGTIVLPFPRIVLDCPTSEPGGHFRPSYDLCTNFVGDKQRALDEIEVGEDTEKVTFNLEYEKSTGCMEMGEKFLDPAKFSALVCIDAQTPLNGVLSLGDGKSDSGSKGCNSGCHKSPAPPLAPLGKPQLSSPQNPFGQFKGVVDPPLAQYVVFTNITDNNEYPGVDYLTKNKKDAFKPTSFSNICENIRKNKDALVKNKTNDVDGPTIDRVVNLCTALYGKVKK